MKYRLNSHWILILTALIFLRGLLPVGFMPNFESLKQGDFDIILCTGVGFKSVHTDFVEPQSPHEPSATTPCWFVVTFGVALCLAVMLLSNYARKTRQRFLPIILSFYKISLLYAIHPRAPPLLVA